MKSGILLACVLAIFSFQGFAQQSTKRTNDHQKSEYRKYEEKERRLQREREELEEEEENDRPDEAILFEFNKTKDPTTGRVPKERLLPAIEFAKKSKSTRFASSNTSSVTASLIPEFSWTERGPNNVGGRTRALIFDLNDSINYLKVWAGGANGGLWYTNDISAASPQWNKVDDRFNNLAVSCIAQSGVTKSVMYFGTGEGWFNSDAVRGLGIWKSTNAGSTWSQLSSTNNSTFSYVQKIVVDNQNNVFAATGGGLQKSTDGGSTWTKVLGSGVNGGTIDFVADIERAPNGDLYCSLGNIYYTPGKIYRSTNSGTTWVDITPAGTSARRIELSTCPSNSDVLYALFQSATTNDCNSIQRYSVSSNVWTACTVPTIIDQGSNSNFTRGQAWYDLVSAVDPNNSNSVYIGGVDALRSDDGGTTWTQMSTWSLYAATGFNSSQNVHADHHAIVFAPGSSSRAVWGTDGGVYYTGNANITGTGNKPTWASKNSGYNVTQYYSCAIHPTSTNYFLAGAQDNGTHKFSTAGINAASQASGGDGGFCHIDKDNPSVQITSYVYNNYYVSTNGGTSFTSYFKNNRGSFINPFDYDNANNILYAGDAAGAYYRWRNPPAGTDSQVTVTAFSGGSVSHVAVSPITNNRVFFGLKNGSVVMVNNADTGILQAGKVIKAAVSGWYVSCIAIDSTNENHLLVTYSNYGVTQVYETKTALQTTPVWTSIQGNLPDMPVRWAMFYPGDSTRAIIATETGVWTTDLINGGSTVWNASTSFPIVRTDMLKYRGTDRTLAAATHGRGLWTTTLPQLVCTPAASTVFATSATVCEGSGTTLSLSQAYAATDYTFQWMSAPTSGGTFTNLATASTQSTGNLSATTYYKCTITCLTNGSSFTTPELAVSVNPIPAAPSVTSGARCGTGTVTLSATPPSGATVAWFSNSTGGTALATTNSYTTPSIASTTNYYVESQIGTACVSTSRSLVTATINPIPSTPASISISLVKDTCGGRIYRYSTPAVSGTATGYQWSFTNTTLGNNAAVDSGSLTSQVVRVKFTSNSGAVAGDSVRVLYTSASCNSVNRSALLTNTSLAPPTAPASITTTLVSNVCGARVYRYSAPALSGSATGWLWSFVGTLGTNAVIDSGTLTSQVVKMRYTLNTAAATGDSARVAYSSPCGNSVNRSSLLTNTLLAAPTAPLSITITSVRDTCNGRIYRYTTPLASGTATGYQWSFVGTLYSTASIDSGTLTSQTLRVKFTNNAAAGIDSARVQYTSACGNSLNRAIKLTNTLLATPTAPASITITSVRDTCNGRIYRYTTPLASGTATGYQWSFVGTLYSTASIDSGTLTSQTLRVKFTNNAAAGTDSARVAYTSGCGTSPRRALKLTNTLLAAPAAPASITITSVRDTCNGRIYRYTAPALSGTATGYQWSFVGSLYGTASIDSGTLTSRILKLKFSSNAAAGTDSARVAYTSGCGTSPRRALKLTNTALVAPATAPVAPVITLVSTTNCTRVYRYSTTSTLTGTATGYLWSFVGTLGSTAVLDSGTLTSRVVRMSFTSPNAAGTDSARVVFTSGCGNSPVARTKLTNTLLTCTPIVGAIANPAGASINDATVNVKVYPNPSLGVFNVQVQTPEKEEIRIKVVDIQGRVIEIVRANPYTNLMIGGKLKPGVYFFEVTQGKFSKSIQVIKH